MPQIRDRHFFNSNLNSSQSKLRGMDPSWNDSLPDLKAGYYGYYAPRLDVSEIANIHS